MVYKIIMAGILLTALPTSAQMADMLSGMGVQGILTRQSTQSVKQGLSQLNKTQLLQDLNRTAMEIKINHPNGYTGVNGASVSGQPFDKVSWRVGPDSSDKFYIQLNGLDESTCRYLVGGMTDARDTFINGVKGYASACTTTNTVKFVFD